MFKRVFFDICAGCNARCPWCQTGNKTRQGQPLPKGAIAPEDFARALDYMFSTEMINQKTVVELYNFAEPFLHPQFRKSSSAWPIQVFVLHSVRTPPV